MIQILNQIFSHQRLRSFTVRYRVILVPLVAIALLYGLGVNKDNLLLAFTCSMFGEAIQLWCFASLDKNSTLAFRGPYAFVRNPMYLGRYFIILGFILLIANLALVLTYTILYWFYMTNRVKREEALLIKVFGQPYKDYCTKIRAFMPRLKPYQGSQVFFWESRLLKQNNGYSNLAATLLVFAVLGLYTLGIK